MLVVSYDELCKTPADALRKVYHHCELDVKDETLQKQAGRISAPAYYKPDFSESELEIIRNETRKTFDDLKVNLC